MLKLRKVAITGGLSCGKSSVCRFFKELGAYVVSADEIVHKVMSLNTPLGRQIIELLGEKIVRDGEIDRSVIAKIVFNDPNLLQSLEKLVHPVVQSEIEKQYQQASIQGNIPLFVAEIPLLFEGSGSHYFDATIAVWADPGTCRRRFNQTTGYGDEEFQRRMANQMTADEKAKRADYKIDNSGDLTATKRQVEALFKKLSNHT